MPPEGSASRQNTEAAGQKCKGLLVILDAGISVVMHTLDNELWISCMFVVQIHD